MPQLLTRMVKKKLIKEKSPGDSTHVVITELITNYLGNLNSAQKSAKTKWVTISFVLAVEQRGQRCDSHQS